MLTIAMEACRGRTPAIVRNLLKPGIDSLLKHIQLEIDELRRTPILMIASSPSSESLNLKSVSDACQWMNFTFRQQFSLRIIPATISSAYPTEALFSETLELMRRTGASSTVAIGSGPAIDLAKMVHAKNHEETCSSSNNNNRLILVPTTYGGILAAGTSHSLLLDNENETLVPYPKSRHQINNTNNDIDDTTAYLTTPSATVAILGSTNYIEPLDKDNIKFDILLYATSAILLDAALNNCVHPMLPSLLQNTIDLIQLRNSGDLNCPTNASMMKRTITELLYKSGSLVSYGLGDNGVRSITVALSSSLIPTIFPDIHPLNFVASLVPGLCSSLPIGYHNDDDIKGKLQNLVELLQQRSSKITPPPPLLISDETLEGFSVPDMALPHIKSNQDVWEAMDAPNDILMHVLQHSLKKPMTY